MGWFVCETKPHKEQLAVEPLHRQNFRAVMLGFLVKLRQGAIVERALFPSYIFVEFAIDVHRWQAIHSTIGCRRLLCDGSGTPRPLPQQEVERLMELYGDGPKLRLEQGRVFKAGQLLRIKMGPLSGHVGLCQLSDGERVKILLKMLGERRPVTLRTDQVELA